MQIAHVTLTFMVTTSAMFTKIWLGFRGTIAVIREPLSSPEVLPCGFSFPGSQSFSCGDC
jgi:hypothetical protein